MYNILDCTSSCLTLPNSSLTLTHAAPTLSTLSRNLGLAFQLVDDILDFTSSSAEMGKPALADLRAGLATGPALFAAQVRTRPLALSWAGHHLLTGCICWH